MNRRTVFEVAEAALEQSEEMRAKWLKEACKDDSLLFKEVLSLLGSESMDTQKFAFTPPSDLSDDLSGTQIGIWRLNRLLGRGGMGSVWLANRNDSELRMQAAVKLVNLQLARPELLVRFKRERQIMADLRHAYIARILDAGTTNDGRLYFIMEYVDGKNIVRWAREHEPDLETVLRLFRKLIDAVAFAHRKGVIHRDIKPGNVLVTADGDPILLDFGIAHTVDTGEASKLTLEGHVLMTPAYAAPEQIRGKRATPRFDIYALGLLLRELLADHYSSEKSENPDSFEEETLAKDNETAVFGKELINKILGSIFARALAENPNKRYVSCEDMLADLDHLLAIIAPSSVASRSFNQKGPGQIPKPGMGRRASDYEALAQQSIQDSIPDSNFTTMAPGDVLDVDSPMYVERALIDEQCFEAVARPGSLIRIKGPWQMGKTSLLVRICRHAERLGQKSAAINFQIAEERTIQDLDAFLKWFCAVISRKLKISIKKLDEYWDDIFGAKDNCTAYFEEVILSEVNNLTLALDEVDRLFEYAETANEFLSLLRVWHELGKTNVLWRKMRLIVVHSTEIYLPMNINQSPFNVGLPVSLPEFSQSELLTLASRYGLDWNEDQVEVLMKMVGGHPCLAQLTFYEISQKKMNLDELLATAATEQGLYANHLKRQLRFLEQNPELADAMAVVVNKGKPLRLDSTTAFKLKSMGLVKQQGNDVGLRCELYQQYFKDRLEYKP